MFVADSVVTHIGSVSTGMKAWQRVSDYWFNSRWHYFSKNHGRAYAGLATVLHLVGGSLHWLRSKLTRSNYANAPHFLRTLARHDLAALFSSKSNPQADPRPQVGE